MLDHEITHDLGGFMFTQFLRPFVVAIGLTLTANFSFAQPGSLDIAVDSQGYSAQGRQYYNFGIVWLNTRQAVRYTVTNTGDQPLVFKQARISGSAFDAYHNCSKGLQPQEKCSFTVTFWPAFEGLYSGTFVLSFTEDRVIVDLWGEGRRM